MMQCLPNQLSMFKQRPFCPFCHAPLQVHMFSVFPIKAKVNRFPKKLFRVSSLCRCARKDRQAFCLPVFLLHGDSNYVCTRLTRVHEPVRTLANPSIFSHGFRLPQAQPAPLRKMLVSPHRDQRPQGPLYQRRPPGNPAACVVYSSTAMCRQSRPVSSRVRSSGCPKPA